MPKKKRERSLLVQLIWIPLIVLGVIVVVQLLYGFRVAEIMNTNAQELRTATLKQIASELQTALDGYKLFVANHIPDAQVQKALKGTDQLAAYQARQQMEEDWLASFQLYPGLTGIFLREDDQFWNMINPLENYERQRFAVSTIQEWAENLEAGKDPYSDSWILLENGEDAQFLVCVLRENQLLSGVWVDVAGIQQKVNSYYENQYHYVFSRMDAAPIQQENLISEKRTGLENITVHASIEGGKFAILEEVSRQELFRELYRMNHFLLFLIFATILLFAWYMYMNYHRIVRSIQKLINAMNQTMQTGEIILAESDHAFREFYHLIEIYNRFSQRIDSLEDHIAQEKIRFQKVKRQYLELQIRPHFYVNIISGVLGYMNSQNMDQAKELLQCMATHLGYILYNKEGKTKLGEEIRFAQNYLQIQRLRFGECFTFDVLVDPEFMDILVPVLSVQTFIENTCKYVSAEEGICVRLEAELSETSEAEYLRVTLADNGNGFPEEILDAFREHADIIYQGRKHIGIQNLYERMRQLYGEDFTMELRNGAPGAVICWEIPVM